MKNSTGKTDSWYWIFRIFLPPLCGLDWWADFLGFSPRALEAVLERRVNVSIIVETLDASEEKIAFDGLPTLGQLILSQAQMFIWPLEKRPVDQEGRHGSLHAKCAIVGGCRIFISSANLTEFALSLNMEMGVLIESSDLAQQAEKHINQLITYGILRCSESS